MLAQIERALIRTVCVKSYRNEIDGLCSAVYFIKDTLERRTRLSLALVHMREAAKRNTHLLNFVGPAQGSAITTVSVLRDVERQLSPCTSGLQGSGWSSTLFSILSALDCRVIHPQEGQACSTIQREYTACILSLNTRKCGERPFDLYSLPEHARMVQLHNSSNTSQC